MLREHISVLMKILGHNSDVGRHGLLNVPAVILIDYDSILRWKEGLLTGGAQLRHSR
jgi:hypothetical protein